MKMHWPARMLSIGLILILLSGCYPLTTTVEQASTISEARNPSVQLRSVPAYGEWGQPLTGQVTGIDPALDRIACLIYVNGWWNKPSWDERTVPISPDGSWSCAITTGGIDEQATQIVAVVVAASFEMPRLAGEKELPSELRQQDLVSVSVEREASVAARRTLQFSGRTWIVKSSHGLVGPGPNYFSDHLDDVWVDAQGRLHLRIAQHEDHWSSAEVISEAPLGYGHYTFRLGSPVNALDPNAVLGLFTWDDAAAANNYREIDIEFSRWGQQATENAQYVVQPYERSGNMYRFNTSSAAQSTHCFNWQPDSVTFQSCTGVGSCPCVASEAIATWIYDGTNIPPAGSGNARINLWLFGGQPPVTGQPVEVIVDSFEFIP